MSPIIKEDHPILIMAIPILISLFHQYNAQTTKYHFGLSLTPAPTMVCVFKSLPPNWNMCTKWCTFLMYDMPRNCSTWNKQGEEIIAPMLVINPWGVIETTCVWYQNAVYSLHGELKKFPTYEFPSQSPVMWSFGISLICALNKRLSKQSRLVIWDTIELIMAT